MKQLKLDHSRTIEKMRDEYEVKIDELELNLRKCQKTIVELEGTVLTLNTKLEKKYDVEKQRDMWRERHDNMDV